MFNRLDTNVLYRQIYLLVILVVGKISRDNKRLKQFDKNYCRWSETAINRHTTHTKTGSGGRESFIFYNGRTLPHHIHNELDKITVRCTTFVVFSINVQKFQQKYCRLMSFPISSGNDLYTFTCIMLMTRMAFD